MLVATFTNWGDLLRVDAVTKRFLPKKQIHSRNTDLREPPDPWSTYVLFYLLVLFSGAIWKLCVRSQHPVAAQGPSRRGHE
jgi:hypothetical protein